VTRVVNRPVFVASFVSVIACSLIPVSVTAEMKRQHEAHEHGHAILNVAQEGKEIELSFEIPAMDMVGFEHQPSNQAQKDKIQGIYELLKQGNKVVAFNSAASCALESAKVESALLEKGESDHHDHKDHHDDHAKHEDHHDDHKDHDHHEEHHDDHENHGDEESHSEFELTYHFECENPAKLAELQVKLFDHTSTLEEIEASWFGDTAVKTAELSPAAPMLKLR
jgi:hypothetical protein